MYIYKTKHFCRKLGKALYSWPFPISSWSTANLLVVQKCDCINLEWVERGETAKFAADYFGQWQIFSSEAQHECLHVHADQLVQECHSCQAIYNVVQSVLQFSSFFWGDRLRIASREAVLASSQTDFGEGVGIHLCKFQGPRTEFSFHICIYKRITKVNVYVQTGQQTWMW